MSLAQRCKDFAISVNSAVFRRESTDIALRASKESNLRFAESAIDRTACVRNYSCRTSFAFFVPMPKGSSGLRLVGEAHALFSSSAMSSAAPEADAFLTDVPVASSAESFALETTGAQLLCSVVYAVGLIHFG